MGENGTFAICCCCCGITAVVAAVDGLLAEGGIQAVLWISVVTNTSEKRLDTT